MAKKHFEKHMMQATFKGTIRVPILVEKGEEPKEVMERIADSITFEKSADGTVGFEFHKWDAMDDETDICLIDEDDIDMEIDEYDGGCLDWDVDECAEVEEIEVDEDDNGEE